MAKINFSKVEGVLNSELCKMRIAELGKMADISQSLGSPEMRKLAEEAIFAAAKQGVDRKALLHVLKKWVKQNPYPGENFYREFELTSTSLSTMLENAKNLTRQDWSKLQKVKAKVLAEKKNSAQDEQMVEKARNEQVNARINVKKTWLPLQ